MVAKFIEMLQQPFMHQIFVGGVLIAALCAYLGVYIVLKRIVFVGAALAQASSAGVALAFFLSARFSGLRGFDFERLAPVTALAFTLGVVMLLALQKPKLVITHEASIGIYYAVLSAVAVLLLAVAAQGEADILNLLFGNILAISWLQVGLLLGLVVVVGALHACFSKEFLFVSFDPEMAQTLGLRAAFWDLLLYLSLGLTISLTIRMAGALVVFTYLVIPAATALVLCGQARLIFWAAIIIGVLDTLGGISLSYILDLPTGSTIIALSGLTLLLCLGFLKLRAFLPVRKQAGQDPAPDPFTMKGNLS